MSALPFSLVLVLVAIVAAAPKEARFKVCKKAQPADKLNECVRDALQRAVPELVKGLPEYELHSIDPLRVDSLEVAKSPKSAVSVDISFKNLDIIGLANAKIKSAKMDVKKNKLSTTVEVDGQLMLQGGYTINGKVLVLPIVGEGRCNITLVRPTLEITELSYKPMMKKGKEYAYVDNLVFKVNHVDRVHYHLDNLFNGNKELGDNMNLVLNDNWNDIYKEVIKPVERALGLAFRHIANRLANKIPFNSFFT